MINDIVRSRGSIQSAPRPMINYRPDEPVIRRRDISRAAVAAVPTVDTVTPKTVVSEVFTQTFETVTPYDVLIQQIEARSVQHEERITPESPVLVAESSAVHTAKKRHFVSMRYLFAGLAATLVLAGTGYISIDTWMTNQQVKQVVAKDTTNSTAVVGEGQSEAIVTPSAIDSYAVAGDLPRTISIDKINVKARVLPMSVNADGTMQAPINIFDSGWYAGSAKPGTPGAAVIDAHASGATREGLFAYLNTLVVGDTIEIEKGDGTKLKYRVTHTETVGLDTIDMQKLLKPHGNAKEGLNLITCTGEWLKDKNTYDQRALVYTERING